MFGFLNVYKPKGKTSHDVVAILRRVTKIKQIGHTGTLDPFAEGVLPICIGKSTRLIEYLKDNKAYIGTVQFGKSTDTYDIEGKVVNTSDKKVNLKQISKELDNFKGTISQTPPIYSALKLNGKKLYEYARKGEDVEVKPREVTINKLEVIEFNEKEQKLKLYIDCSKGTYIRSIANDLGEKLGVYGHLTELKRVKAGDFKIDSAVTLDKLHTAEDVRANLLNPLSMLDFPKYKLNENELEKIIHGNPIEISLNDCIAILTYNDRIVSIGNVIDKRFKCSKVFEC